MSQELTLRPNNREYELFKQNEDRGLKLFLENRLLNNLFIENIGLDNLRIAAGKLYKGSRTKFNNIYDESVAFTEHVRCINKEDYGEKWGRVIYKCSRNRYENLNFYCDALLANQVIERWSNAEEGRILYRYDAASIYNLEYLDPPLNSKQFGKVWWESERRYIYMSENDLTPCACP